MKFLFFFLYHKNNSFASILPSSLLYNLKHAMWYFIFSQDNRKVKYSIIQLLFIIGIMFGHNFDWKFQFLDISYKNLAIICYTF